MRASTLSHLAAVSLGAMSILTALPMLGLPFPSRTSAEYYTGKTRWIADLSGNRLTHQQARYASAGLRILAGSCCIFPPTRELTLLGYTAIVVYGTLVAYRDGRPMLPQWGTLAGLGVCLLLGRLRF